MHGILYSNVGEKFDSDGINVNLKNSIFIIFQRLLTMKVFPGVKCFSSFFQVKEFFLHLPD